MKTHVLLFLALSALTLSAQTPPSEANSPYTLADQGGFYRVWQRTLHLTNYVTGAIFADVHRYIQLDDGVCFLDTTGQWSVAQDLVELTSTGAAALHGQTKAYFLPNLNTPGAITLNTAAGQTFQSHPIGLYYRDLSSGKVALIAPLQDTRGMLVPPNTVVFSNAFSGLQASVVYVYAHNGFDQSVVLSQAPPPPDLLANLDPASCRLEIWTALDQWPAPRKQRAVTIKQGANPQLDLVDHLLFFADTWLPVGAAFVVGDENAPVTGQPTQVRLPDLDDTNNIPVAKSIQQVGNQSVLVESANYEDLLPKLKTLQQAALPSDRAKAKPAVAQGRELPPVSAAKAVSRPLQLASAGYVPRGLVLDYVNPLSGTVGAFTFSNGWTYVISNSFTVGSSDATVTWQNNTYIKYASNAYLLDSSPYLTFPSSGTPPVFTSKDDNVYGETVSGSSGLPNYAASQEFLLYYPDNGTTVQNARFRWAQKGIEYDNNTSQTYSHTLNSSAFQNSNIGVYVNLGGSSLSLSSDTSCATTTPFSYASGYYSGSLTTDCELNIAQSFAGMNGGSSSDVGHPTPDTDGAIGPTNFVEILNEKIAVYDKSSGTQLAILGTQTFFTNTVNNTNYPTSDTEDPRVIYDQQSTCWVACAIDKGSQEIMFAYMPGTSPLPLTNWTKTTLYLANTNTSDSPTLGVDNNGVYLSLLRFINASPSSIADNIIACLPKPGVYQGSTAMTILTNDLSTWKVQVGINLDATPSGGYAWCVFKGLPQTSPSYTNALSSG